MSEKPPAAPPSRPTSDPPRWTKPEDYLDVARLWRRSAARVRRRLRPRTEPERPRFSLGTLPFLLLILALMFVALSIILAAVPGRRYSPPPEPAERQVGTAPPGWLPV